MAKQKLAVTTLAIKAGIVDRVDGEIYSPETLEVDIQALIEKKGYKMSLKEAVKKVRLFSERKSDQYYGYGY
jgi:hypothetical protein